MYGKVPTLENVDFYLLRAADTPRVKLIEWYVRIRIATQDVYRYGKRSGSGGLPALDEREVGPGNGKHEGSEFRI